MKNAIILFVVLTMTSLVHAGTAPETTCSNEGGHITMERSRVTIQYYNHQDSKFETEKIRISDLNIEMEMIKEMDEQTRGCSTRKVFFQNVTLSKKDGTPLRNAYNRNAVGGVLNDYMICSTSYAWMPAPGESCFK